MDKFKILCESIKVNLDLLAATYSQTAQAAFNLQQENVKLKKELAELKTEKTPKPAESPKTQPQPVA